MSHCRGPADEPIRGYIIELAKPPYPFCRTPDQCAGKGYCTKDPACND